MDDRGKDEFRRNPLYSSGSVTAKRTGLESSPSVKSPLHSSGSTTAMPSGKSPLHTSGSTTAMQSGKSPLHTSGSVAVTRSAKSPLHSSGSVTARGGPDSSSGTKVGGRRGSLYSSGSIAAQGALASGQSAKGGYWPGPEYPPESVAEVGVRQPLLEELALKILYMSGPFTLRELVALIRLPFGVVNELLRRMRAEQLCEVTGMAGNVPQIAITSQGRARAAEYLTVNQYTGPAPVSFDHYRQQIQNQSVRHLDVDEPLVEQAFGHLVVDAEMLEQLGTALNSGASIFLYGPTGTGKTTIAAALAQVLAVDRVWIPHAIEVDGQIICVYDADVHKKINDPAAQSSDQRWVLCHRPTVLVGGELTLEMLELQFNPIAKVYMAPVQMKANNGVLIIDDFGRQRMRPEELLNRWVVPLDRRIDFLTLAGGKKIEIPFEPCVVFATNMDPSSLGDEAFLRRIQTKIKVGNISEQQFHAIFQAVCGTCGLEAGPELIDELITVIRKELKEPLRACHPQDLVNRICWKARYKRAEPCLDRDTLLAAVDSYFLREPEKSEAEEA